MANSEEKFLAMHPDPNKKGVNISKEKYDIIRDEIISSLRRSELSHTQINNLIKSRLKKKFSGSVSWYVETVKLDLEARGEIERNMMVKPPIYRLKGKR
jgi:hypothetical protein